MSAGNVWIIHVGIFPHLHRKPSMLTVRRSSGQSVPGKCVLDLLFPSCWFPLLLIELMSSVPQLDLWPWGTGWYDVQLQLFTLQTQETATIRGCRTGTMLSGPNTSVIYLLSASASSLNPTVGRCLNKTCSDRRSSISTYIWPPGANSQTWKYNKVKAQGSHFNEIHHMKHDFV